ncbi:hypothetical protein C8J57DRAFT_1306883, partial [Mycena rebaudengoi]
PLACIFSITSTISISTSAWASSALAIPLPRLRRLQLRLSKVGAFRTQRSVFLHSSECFKEHTTVACCFYDLF